MNALVGSRGTRHPEPSLLPSTLGVCVCGFIYLPAPRMELGEAPGSEQKAQELTAQGSQFQAAASVCTKALRAGQQLAYRSGGSLELGREKEGRDLFGTPTPPFLQRESL